MVSMKSTIIFIFIFIFTFSTFADELFDKINQGNVQQLEAYLNEKKPAHVNDGIGLAIEIGSANILEALLKHGAALKSGIAEKICATGHFHLLGNFAAHGGISQDDSQTLFYCALDQQRDEVLPIVGNNISGEKKGEALLHLIREKKPVPKALFDLKPNVNVKDEAGITALHYAVSQKDALLVSTLLSLGARTDIKDIDGKTAAQLAKELKVSLKVKK